MLVFGNAKILPLLSQEKFAIYNFSSMIMGVEKLDLIPEPNEIDFFDEKSFDIAYSYWIMTNDSKFIELMKIVYPLYCGINVLVLVNWYDNMSNYFYANLNESLMKFIQSRYGYNATIINEPEDYIEQSSFDLESSFSIEGLGNIDSDKYRLAYLLESNRDDNPIMIPGFKYADRSSPY